MATLTAKVISKPLQVVRATRSFRDIPGPWPSLPLVGTNWQYWGRKQNLFQLHKAFEEKRTRYGPICKEEYQFRRPVVHLFNAEHFPDLFRAQGSCPIRPPTEFVCKYRRENSDRYPGVGLSNALGEEWRQLRLALAPLLRQIGDQASFKDNFGTAQWEICVDWVRHLESLSVSGDGSIDNIQESIYMLALESIFTLCLERRLGCFEGDARAIEMVQAVKDLFISYQKLYYGSPLWKKFATKPYREFSRAEDTIYRLTEEFLAESSKSGVQSRVVRTMMAVPFTLKDIQLTVMDFLAGGVFTLTQSLTFFIHQLATNERVQAKMYSAVRKCESEERGSSANHPYVKACLKESLRLAPSVPGVMRILPQDTVLCGYHIPAETAVFVNSMIACRDEEAFPQALEFLPERWMQGRPQHPFALLPFGFGARMCVGRHIAELEMCSAVAALIDRFEISTSLPQIPLRYVFVITPDGDVPIKMRLRQDTNTMPTTTLPVTPIVTQLQQQQQHQHQQQQQHHQQQQQQQQHQQQPLLHQNENVCPYGNSRRQNSVAL